ncbi:hypothetical protein BC835DRAFT_574192 [Cytidiella melzeri]|nr:hypothetical protein BC835DRAFT_574192 [Cytidiella melzeri]
MLGVTSYVFSKKTRIRSSAKSLSLLATSLNPQLQRTPTPLRGRLTAYHFFVFIIQGGMDLIGCGAYAPKALALDPVDRTSICVSMHPLAQHAARCTIERCVMLQHSQTEPNPSGPWTMRMTDKKLRTISLPALLPGRCAETADYPGQLSKPYLEQPAA